MRYSTSITIIGTLLVVSGIIAYWGDVVGKRMGKKRLSLLGLRPRQTGTLMSIATGILIQVFSIAVLTIISRAARTALFEFDTLQKNVTRLRAENLSLENHSRVLKERNGRLTRNLGDTLTQLGSTRKELQSQAVSLRQRQRDIARLESRQGALRNQLQQLRAEMHHTQELLKVADRRYQKTHARYVKVQAKLLGTESRLQEAQDSYKVARDKLDATQKDLKERNKELANAEQEINNATQLMNKSNRQLSDLQKQKDDLRVELEGLQQTKQLLDKDVSDLKVIKAGLETQRAELAGTVTSLVGKDVVVERGEILLSSVVAGGRPVEDVKQDLRRIIQEARDAAQKRGAQGKDNKPPLSIASRYVEGPDGRRVYFYEEHVVDKFAQDISASRDDAIVEVIALFNSVEGDPVDADLRLFPNRFVFTKGTVLVQESLDGRKPTGALFQQVLGTLEKIRSIAKEKGMRGGAENRYGEISYEELFDVLERVRRIKSQVNLKIIVSEDTRAAGPLHIRFEVERIPRQDTNP